jgi:hypothetical protein
MLLSVSILLIAGGVREIFFVFVGFEMSTVDWMTGFYERGGACKSDEKNFQAFRHIISCHETSPNLLPMCCLIVTVE